MNDKLKRVKEFIYEDNIQNKIYEINNHVKALNIFEISGMGHQEVKHSRTLGWFLGDKQHGLKNIFLNEFLKAAIHTTTSTSDYFINEVIIDKLQKYIYLSNNKDIEILYEHQNIDILIIDNMNKIVFIVENKVFASESDEQLSKYRESIEKLYPIAEYTHFGLFLTPSGESPRLDAVNYEKNRSFYMLITYEDVKNLLEKIIRNRNHFLSNETKLVIEHYLDLLIRSNIVPNTELEVLCKEIWKNEEYSKALDILNEYKVDKYSELSDFIQEKINEQSNDYVIPDDSTKSYIRFADSRIDDIPEQKSGNKQWTKTNRVILFEFVNHSNNGLIIKLHIGPGNDIFRKLIFDGVKSIESKIKYYKGKEFRKKWNQVFTHTIINKNEINEKPIDELKEKINHYLIDFFSEEGKFNLISNDIDIILQLHK